MGTGLRTFRVNCNLSDDSDFLAVAQIRSKLKITVQKNIVNARLRIALSPSESDEWEYQYKLKVGINEQYTTYKADSLPGLNQLYGQHFLEWAEEEKQNVE